MEQVDGFIPPDRRRRVGSRLGRTMATAAVFATALGMPRLMKRVADAIVMDFLSVEWPDDEPRASAASAALRSPR